MIGVMIKVCALDFLNREFFDTDVMTADGKVLFSSGDTVTPNIILRLYFKDIYIEEAVTTVEKEITVDFEHKELVSSSAVPISEASAVPTPVEIVAKAQEMVTTEPIPIEIVVAAQEEVTAGPRSIEIEAIPQEEVTTGPKSIGISPVEKEKVIYGANFAEANEPETTENESNLSPASAAAEIEEAPKETPESPLKFDEDQAKRIVASSIKIGKLLNFTEKDLKDLEQVAYYCNIGITQFKRADLAKKEFRKMKAFASYEHITNEGVASTKIAEMVKLCANNYESESFPLDPKIPTPYHSIVAITSYYEELLAQNKSKQETLLKMLQLGGNQFNIFILHKFIKMMRDSND